MIKEMEIDQMGLMTPEKIVVDKKVFGILW
jgi:hypothetical protein